MLIRYGKGLDIEVDLTKLGFTDKAAGNPETPAGSIVYLGLRNRLMDAHASVTATEYPDEDERKAAAAAKAQKVLDALYNGDVRSVGTREGDPVKAEAKRLAVKAVEAQIRARKPGSGKSNKVKDYDRATITAAADKIMDRFMAQAKKNVEAAKAAINEADIDLDDIMGDAA